jgi:hypothetical protein
MVSTVVIILTFVVAVYGHECKDFKLSASDQSVIDMMKHYLYTSRQTECSDNKLSNTFKELEKFLKVSNFKYFQELILLLQDIR